MRKNYTDEKLSRCSSAIAITPNDSTDNVNPVGMMGLCVGVDGDVNVIFADDTAAVLLKGRAAGDYPYIIKRVLATGTTATNLVALY